MTQQYSSPNDVLFILFFLDLSALHKIFNLRALSIPYNIYIYIYIYIIYSTVSIVFKLI